MRTLEKYLIVAYFFLCPLEIALNIVFTSTTKYIGVLMIAVYLMKLLYGMDLKLNITRHVGSLLLWIASCALTFIWGSVSTKTYGYMITYLEMSVMVIICTYEKWSSDEISLFTATYCIGSVVTAGAVILLGGAKFYGRETIEIFGQYCDPNQLAANIVPGTVILIHYLTSTKTKFFVRLISLPALLLSVYAVLITASRGGLLSILAALVVVILSKLSSHEIKISSGILIFMIGAIALHFLPQVASERLLKFDTYTDTYASGRSRLTIWGGLLSDFDTTWIIGHGVGSTISYFQMLYGKILGVHNTFLLVLYEVGIVGFVLFIYPYVSLIIYHFKEKNTEIVSLIVGALVSSFFLDSLNLRYLWNGLILGIMLYNINNETDEPEIYSRKKCKYFL